MDEVHCCVLRALCIDETPKERAERKLDPALLDHLTWPAYVWEFLALTEDPLAVEEWVHRVPLHKRPGAGASGAENGGRHGSGKAGGSGGSKGRQAASAAQSDTAADGEATVAAATARRKSFAPLSTEEQSAIDAVLDAADPAVPALPPAAETFSMPGVPPQPAPAPAEYHRLPVGLKAAILSRLCDHLLDCLTIRAEVDRREAAGEMVAGKGGAGGAFPIMTEEERKAAEEKVGGRGGQHAVSGQQGDAHAVFPLCPCLLPEPAVANTLLHDFHNVLLHPAVACYVLLLAPAGLCSSCA